MKEQAEVLGLNARRLAGVAQTSCYAGLTMFHGWEAYHAAKAASKLSITTLTTLPWKLGINNLFRVAMAVPTSLQLKIAIYFTIFIHDAYKTSESANKVINDNMNYTNKSY